MKLFIILFSVAIASANTFECPVNGNNEIDPQIRSCKMEIIKSECEQRGIKVWSETEVNANSLQADEIKTNSDCDNLGIHIDEIKMTGEKIIIAYSSLNSGDSVHAVSMEQWGQTGSVSHKVTGSVTHVKRSDSTSIVDINVGTQVDSREIKRKLKTWEQKAKLIAAILSSDD